MQNRSHQSRSIPLALKQHFPIFINREIHFVGSVVGPTSGHTTTLVDANDEKVTVTFDGTAVLPSPYVMVCAVVNSDLSITVKRSSSDGIHEIFPMNDFEPSEMEVVKQAATIVNNHHVRTTGIFERISD